MCVLHAAGLALRLMHVAGNCSLTVCTDQIGSDRIDVPGAVLDHVIIGAMPCHAMP